MGVKRVLPIVCAAALGFASGCGSDSSGPSNVDISDQQAQEAGSLIGAQVADLASGFTLQDFGGSPFAKAASLLPPSSRFDRDMLQRAWPRFHFSGATCASFTDTTDTDADGVPDDLVVRFDQPGCIEVGDSITATLSGSFRITDPGVDPGFNIAYSTVRLRLDHVSGDYLAFGIDGTHGASATTANASANQNMTFSIGARSGTQTANLSLSQNWTAGFAAAAGSEVVVREPLPSGAITVAGSSTWTANRTSFAFAMSTTEPLQHDATCLQEPTLSSGEVRALVSGNQGGAFVRVQFTGCGEEPIVTLVGRPAR